MKHLVGFLVMIGAMVLVGVVSMLIYVGADDGTSIFDTEPGDCFMLELSGADVEIDEVEVVACDQPHDAEVVARGSLNPDGDRDYPDDNELFIEVDRLCPPPDTYVNDGFALIPVAPNEASWTGQDGAYACVAITRDGNTTTGSLTTPIANQ